MFVNLLGQGSIVFVYSFIYCLIIYFLIMRMVCLLKVYHSVPEIFWTRNPLFFHITYFIVLFFFILLFIFPQYPMEGRFVCTLDFAGPEFEFSNSFYINISFYHLYYLHYFQKNFKHPSFYGARKLILTHRLRRSRFESTKCLRLSSSFRLFFLCSASRCRSFTQFYVRCFA